MSLMGLCVRDNFLLSKACQVPEFTFLSWVLLTWSPSSQWAGFHLPPAMVTAFRSNSPCCSTGVYLRLSEAINELQLGLSEPCRVNEEGTVSHAGLSPAGEDTVTMPCSWKACICAYSQFMTESSLVPWDCSLKLPGKSLLWCLSICSCHRGWSRSVKGSLWVDSSPFAPWLLCSTPNSPALQSLPHC